MSDLVVAAGPWPKTLWRIVSDEFGASDWELGDASPRMALSSDERVERVQVVPAGPQVTEEMKAAAGRAVAECFGMDYERDEFYTETYWDRIAAKALEAALSVSSSGGVEGDG